MIQTLENKLRRKSKAMSIFNAFPAYMQQRIVSVIEAKLYKFLGDPENSTCIHTCIDVILDKIEETEVFNQKLEQFILEHWSLLRKKKYYFLTEGPMRELRWHGVGGATSTKKKISNLRNVYKSNMSSVLNKCHFSNRYFAVTPIVTFKSKKRRAPMIYSSVTKKIILKASPILDNYNFIGSSTVGFFRTSKSYELTVHNPSTNSFYIFSALHRTWTKQPRQHASTSSLICALPSLQRELSSISLWSSGVTSALSLSVSALCPLLAPLAPTQPAALLMLYHAFFSKKLTFFDLDETTKILAFHEGYEGKFMRRLYALQQGKLTSVSLCYPDSQKKEILHAPGLELILQAVEKVAEAIRK